MHCRTAGGDAADLLLHPRAEPARKATRDEAEAARPHKNLRAESVVLSLQGKPGAALRLCPDPSAYPLDPSLLGLPAWHLAALASNSSALWYLQGCAQWWVLLVYHATAAGWQAGWLLAGWPSLAGSVLAAGNQ
eukprot:COSAG01_NODE_26779_length_703_cov_1.668874_1_plen_134_part_00